MDENKTEYETKLEEYAQLLDIRAGRIRVSTFRLMSPERFICLLVKCNCTYNLLLETGESAERYCLWHETVQDPTW